MKEADEKTQTTGNEIYEARIYLGKKKVSTISLSEGQVKRLKYEIWNDYNHQNNNVLVACGLTKQHMEDLKHLMFEFIKENRRTSKLCEKLEQTLTTRELAFLSSQHILETIEKAQAMAHLFGMLTKEHFGDGFAPFRVPKSKDDDEGGE
jgi:hypothetical protein